MATIRILIVEDELIVAQDLRLLLGRLGYESDVVRTGEQALEALHAKRYHLVLLDVALRGQLDGIESASDCGSSGRFPSSL